MSSDDIDAIFCKIGFGRWQMITVAAAILGPAALAPALIGSTLTNAPVTFKCRSDQEVQQSTETIYDNECHVTSLARETWPNNVSIENDLNSDASGANGSPHPNGADSEQTIQFNQSCKEWDYDTSVFTSTIAMEWNLTCGDAWLSSLYQIIISAGCMVGDVVGGAIGDRLGRRATLRYGSMIVVASVLGIGLIPYYSVVLACRLILGLTLSSIIYPTYNLVMEITPTYQRTIVAMILCSPYSVAVMIFAGLGYFIRDWRTLHLMSSVFALLLLPISWMVDESPRWLAQKGYSQRAKEVLQKASKLNKSTLPSDSELENVIQKLADEGGTSSNDHSKSNKGGLRVVFSSRPMAIIAVITPISWFLMGVIYLGIPLNVANFGGNPFLYLGLTGVMELLPTVVGVVFSKRFSRVPVMATSYFVSGVCCLAMIFLKEEVWWVRWILVMVAMEMISTSYMMSYVWAPELYPTVIRSNGCGSCALFGHLGYFVAPFITDFLAKRIWWLPNGILGACGVVAGSIVFLLPETKGLNLCETIQDVEDRRNRRRNKPQEVYKVKSPRHGSLEDLSKGTSKGGENECCP